MQRLINKIKPHLGKTLGCVIVIFFGLIAYQLYQAPVSGFEHKFVYLLKTYGYVILFAWAILEGEAGLIMAGLLSHTGDMNVGLAVFIAGLGGFVGDQIYFYIGRYNKQYVHRKFKGQRRKFALAHLLLQKYGWPIIFAQRYMYGLRTIIPISIGLTRYNARKFAFINLISAWCWAAITIIPTWYFGKHILILLHWVKEHAHLAIPLAGVIALALLWYFHTMTKKSEKRPAPATSRNS
ncbi:DedA family protein [Dongshaea marina]|uniref:DedA family protein n=1 Tax=Dongshaea marina TaxID=2047966 RepID=UPI000D3E58B5|nr:DedA family protein [Dongshaea marina]